MAKYLCKKIKGPIEIDGNLNKQVWQDAVKTDRFIDVIGGTPAIYDTRAALLYDDEYLYIGIWSEDPYPQAKITQRDGLIWFENDLEIFIGGEDCYYEFQLNALNTIYEVFYVWQDAYSKKCFQVPELDIFENKAVSFGGNHDRTGEYFWKGSHPRGNRWAFLNWDFEGLKSAVKIDGVLNDDSVVSKGLTAEIAFPWKGMKQLAEGRSLPPKNDDMWKIFVGRYQQMRLNGEQISVGWAMDKIGTNDNHYPEKFSEIQFCE